MSNKKTTKKSVETFVHDEASRKNIPTAEYQSVMRKDQQTPIQPEGTTDPEGLSLILLGSATHESQGVRVTRDRPPW